MDKKKLVVHHNRLTESIIRYDEFELNTFIAIVYKMTGIKEKVIFDVEDIKKYTMLKNRDYKSFSTLISKLQTKTIELKTENGYKKIIPFPTLDFNLKEKIVAISINEDIQPLLENLKQQFTKYLLHEFLALESKYGKRLFQLLKQWESVGVKDFPVKFLKEFLCAEHYEKFERFETKAVKRAVEDINNNTEMNVEYEKIKEGRSITGIKFSINRSSPKPHMTPQNDKNVTVKKLSESRKAYLARALRSFGVKSVKELNESQRKMINIGLQNLGYSCLKAR